MTTNKENGAPEEIRTPDPQIRRPGQAFEITSESRKPAESAVQSNQCASGPVANRNDPPDPQKESAALLAGSNGAAESLDGNSGLKGSTSKRFEAMARAFDPFAPVAGLGNVVGFRGAHVARFEPSPALDDLDRVIALADELSGDIDREDDGSGDDEPSLGWTISGNTIGYCDGEGEPSLASIDDLDQSRWASGGTLDHEPSLASIDDLDQSRWASGGTLDHEPWLAELDEVRA